MKSSTRNRTVVSAIACAVVVLLLAVIAVFANTAIGYIPVIAAMVLIALDVAYLMVLKRSVTFKGGSHVDSCTRTDTVELPLILANGSFLPAPRIDVTFTIKDGLGSGVAEQTRQLTLPPHDDNVFDLGVRFDHLGIVEVGISRVAVFDLLGLFCSTRVNDALERVQVLPHVENLAMWDVSEHSVRESQTNVKTFISDGMDYSGIRDYRWGDPMKSIHWKLSSKTEDTYFTRLYEKPTTPGIAVFIDLECPSEDSSYRADVFDAVVESALSVERFAARVGYETEVLYVGTGGTYRRIEGPLGDRYASFMRRVPRLGEGDGTALHGLLLTEARSVTCQNNLVVCTCNITEALVSAMTSAASPVCRPFLVAVMPEQAQADGLTSEQQAAMKRLEASRIPHMRVRTAADLNAQVG